MASQQAETRSSISRRALRSISQENILLEFFSKAAKNMFHPEDNPTGVINMGTSENKVVADLLKEKLSRINLGDVPNELMQYSIMHGRVPFRNALAKFLTRYMKPVTPIDANDLYVFNGCGSVIELLGFSICDDGDCFLVPAPYYGAFKTDLALRMGCATYSIELTSEIKKEFGETQPFELSVGRMEEAYNGAIAKGYHIKGVIICNPSNPLGNVFTKDQLISYLKFAQKYHLHVILDEIYFLSLYSNDVPMTNGLSLVGIIDPDLLHVVWGFSKDFAMSGFRCGVVHTVNKPLASVLIENAYFQSVPTLMQYILQSFIDDFDWLDRVFLPTNSERLRKAREYTCSELQEIGVECHASQGGLFLWVNLKEFMSPPSRENEMKLMETFLENGVYITAGIAFYSPEPGWFRIIFSVKDEELRLGIGRVKKVLTHIKEKRPVEGSNDRSSACSLSTSDESLGDLVAVLQKQMNKSDWLKENTAEKWMEENPELAKKFMEERGKNE